MSDNVNTETEGRITNSDDPTLDAEESWLQAAQTHFDPDGHVELTTAIVTAIAEAEGVDPMEVKSPLLYDVVDVPAIEQSFFAGGEDGTARNATGTTQFRYDRYLVKVRSDGWVQVYE